MLGLVRLWLDHTSGMTELDRGVHNVIYSLDLINNQISLLIFLDIPV